VGEGERKKEKGKEEREEEREEKEDAKGIHLPMGMLPSDDRTVVSLTLSPAHPPFSSSSPLLIRSTLT